MSEVADQRKVSYTRMDLGTVEDYALAEELAAPFIAATTINAGARKET